MATTLPTETLMAANRFRPFPASWVPGQCFYGDHVYASMNPSMAKERKPRKPRPPEPAVTYGPFEIRPTYRTRTSSGQFEPRKLGYVVYHTDSGCYWPRAYRAVPDARAFAVTVAASFADFLCFMPTPTGDGPTEG
jgi:hypothetical protein